VILGGLVTDNDGWESIRRDRLVKNEIAFRDYNNRRVAVEHQADASNEEELVPFVCECGSADCIGALQVTLGDYETAHSTPNRFLVKPDHIYPDVEFIVTQQEHYWVVEKRPGEMPPP
jgi:hypothetical protein